MQICSEIKSRLVIRKNAEKQAESIFKRTNIKITTDGKKDIGEVAGTINYRQNYTKEKTNQWIT